MGDLLMSLPVLRSIRSELRETHITFLIQEGLKPLLEGHPDFDQLLTLPPWAEQGGLTILRLARWLHRFHFDAVLVLNPTRLFHLTSFLAGIPVRIGYRRKWGFLLSCTIADTKHLRHLHEVDYNLELARLLGIAALHREIHLPPRPQVRQEAIRLLKSKGMEVSEEPIAIHPWTSNPAKGWPMEYFWETARQLIAEKKRVILLGEPGANSPFPSAPPGVMDLSRQITLRTLPELLRICSLLISNDSGPAHVAAAVGTPTIVVAPAEHVRQLERWRPPGDQHCILFSPEVADVITAARQRLRVAARG